eukprot:TRINITY_DN67309_c0_g1_i1.p1 TRINITY_DN67309_c0_g1~~TRINITY_DN67309_c0_g1_i1.p1  ORF type:complete len:102 (+),score=11.86 TRINITY_DN67309_c0_g1_i1:117-422(+)
MCIRDRRFSIISTNKSTIHSLKRNSIMPLTDASNNLVGIGVSPEKRKGADIKHMSTFVTPSSTRSNPFEENKDEKDSNRPICYRQEIPDQLKEPSSPCTLR